MILPLTKGGNLSAKDDRATKKMQDAREISEEERVPRAKFARLEPEKAILNGLDQKLYEDDRVHNKEQNVKTSYVTVKTRPSSASVKIKLENKKKNN